MAARGPGRDRPDPPGGLQETARTAPGRPKTAPGPRQDGPRPSPEASQTPQEAPKMAQDRSKRLPDLPKSLPKAPQAGQDASKTLQDGPRRPPEAKKGPQMAPNWHQNGSKIFRNASKDAPKTPQGSLNSGFGGAAVLPALRARSAAPPAEMTAGFAACQTQHLAALKMLPPSLILPPTAIAIIARLPIVLYRLVPSWRHFGQS